MKIDVQGTEITIVSVENQDYISLTDMLRAKEGNFFISDWLRNRNTMEFLGISEKLNNSNFNYGEFAAIRNKTIAISQMKILLRNKEIKKLR